MIRTPSSPHTSRRMRQRGAQRKAVWMLGAGSLALLAGAAVVSRSCERGDRAGTQPAAPSGTPAARRLGTGRTHPAGAGATEADLPPRPETTTCWRDLELFNEGVTIENFRAWAAPLLSANDPHVRSYLKERLTELIGSDPARAEQVIGWSREAAFQDTGLFLSALRASDAVQLPQVAAKLTELGLDARIDVDRRAGFLAALDTQKRLEPAVLDRLAASARDPSAGDAGWTAARTVGRVMAQQRDAAPYMERLLSIGTEAADEDVRYLALSLPMHAAPLLDKGATRRYAQILRTDPSEDVREAAAHSLSLSEDKKGALSVFSSTFAAEHDVCVRWAMFRFAARAAGKDALPTLADMALRDPRFQPDYQAFEQIYASGVVDFERVWLSLPSQDPHGCLDRHE